MSAEAHSPLADSDRERARRFLSGTRPDHRGRRINEVLAGDDESLEAQHDFIQWCFPLPERSAYNVHAPVPSRADFFELAVDVHVQAGVRAALHRMLRFYGLQLDDQGVVSKAACWATRCDLWAFFPTHNDLRITRILRSLGLLGLRGEAQAYLACLEDLAEECRGLAKERPLQFWREAVAAPASALPLGIALR